VTQPAPRWLRQLPNALSATRIAACPVLIVLATLELETAFTWLLVPALLTDIADGIVARAFKLQSRLGALLDSIGDALLLFTSIYGVWALHPDILQQHRVAGGLVVGAWLLEMAASLVRYRRLSSFHTYLSKVAGYLLGIFIGVLFVFGLQPWLLYLAVGSSVLGTLEELMLLWLLPRWRADVRGVYWVLRERQREPVTTP
jgi:CDP-diacylglycerol--glycerol-3-phosphate 3-phosphatidyltransferase